MNLLAVTKGANGCVLPRRRSFCCMSYRDGSNQAFPIVNAQADAQDRPIREYAASIQNDLAELLYLTGLHDIPEAVTVTDMETRFLDWNQRSEERRVGKE